MHVAANNKHKSRRSKAMNRRFLLAATVWACCAAMARAEPLVLRTAAQEAAAPKFILGKNRRVGGLCPDILHAIEKQDPQLRFEVDATPNPITRLMHGVRSGQLDVVCALGVNAERMEMAVYLPTVLYTVEDRLVARADDTVAVGTLAELAALRELVATQPGSTYVATLRDNGIRVDTSSGDDLAGLRKIASGRLRFFYTSDLVASYFIRTAGYEGKLRVLPANFQTRPMHFWVSRTLDPAVAKRLDKALASLRASGELERIHRNYLPKP